MSGPLGDTTRRRLTDAAAAHLMTNGFEIDRPGTRSEPPAIARPADGDAGISVDEPQSAAVRSVETHAGEPLAIEPITPDDATPTVIASRLAHALDRDRRALFVVDDAETAATVESLLAAPALLVGESDRGHRTFHAGPDRIPVTGGGYACVRYEGLGDPAFVWRESDTPVGPVPTGADVDAAAVDDSGRPLAPRLLCEVDGRVVAVLAGVESLRVPPGSAFPYAYKRDPTDKQFRVRRGGDGAVVETVGGFAAMREAGYVPIPMPLVPEHVLGRDESRSLDSAWGILRIDALSE